MNVGAYTNAHAKVKNWIFDMWSPKYRCESGIISSDFKISTILAIPGRKIPKIQPAAYDMPMKFFNLQVLMKFPIQQRDQL